MDGTLIDSEVLFHRSIALICGKYNTTYDSTIKDEAQGSTDEEVSKLIVGRLKLPLTAEEFAVLLQQESLRLRKDVGFKQGAERLLKHLYKHGVPLALATNSKKDAVDFYAAHKAEVFSMFHHMVCVTDPEVKQGKPAPDLYLVASKRFEESPDPKDCLAFEDSAVGVQAAYAAGMQVVLTPEGKIKPEIFKKAALVLNSLLEFQPELFGLPSFADDHKKKFPC